MCQQRCGGTTGSSCVTGSAHMWHCRPPLPSSPFQPGRTWGAQGPSPYCGVPISQLPSYLILCLQLLGWEACRWFCILCWDEMEENVDKPILAHCWWVWGLKCLPRGAWRPVLTGGAHRQLCVPLDHLQWGWSCPFLLSSSASCCPHFSVLPTKDQVLAVASQ